MSCFLLFILNRFLQLRSWMSHLHAQNPSALISPPISNIHVCFSHISFILWFYFHKWKIASEIGSYFLEILWGFFPVSANTPQMVSTAAAPQPGVFLQEIIVGSGIKFAQMILQKWLTEPNREPGAMGVHGMDGVGKTSLLKVIHNHFKKVSEIIFDMLIWFAVSIPLN